MRRSIAYLAGLLVAVAGVLVATRPALAAPVFEAPFPCGQTWTYSFHANEVRQALDFIRTSGPTRGTPVLASAAGTATQRVEPGGAGNYIVVDHGGGWQTYYFHLATFSVASGTRVEAGRQVGTTGATGNVTGDHIHYEQLFNGVGQTIRIDGRSLAPYPREYGVRFLTSDNGCADSRPTATGAGAVYAGGQYRVFGVQGASRQVFVNTYSAGWSGWESLGGSAVGAPAVTYHDSRFDVFVVGTDGSMHQRTWAGSWSAWHSLGGSFSPGGGVAAVYSDGQYRVFGVGADSRVYVNTYSGGWAGWESLGGSAVGAPAVTYHDSRFDVFVVGTDGSMHQRTWAGSWGAWHSLGGEFSPGGGAGAVVSNGQYRVFGVGADSRVYVNTYSGGWAGWESLGGSAVGAPAATYHDNRFDVFVVGTDGAMYQKTWTGSWSAWTSLQGDFR